MTTPKTGLSQFFHRPWTLLDDLSLQITSTGPLATNGKVNMAPIVIFATTSKYKLDKGGPAVFAFKLHVETKYEGHRCYALDPQRYFVTDSKTHQGLKPIFLDTVKADKNEDPTKRYKKFAGTFSLKMIMNYEPHTCARCHSEGGY